MALSEQVGRRGEAARSIGVASHAVLFFLWVALLMVPERGWRTTRFRLGTA